MSNPLKPCRQRRLTRIYESSTTYFLTLCTDERKRVLDNHSVFKRAQKFAAESLERYGVFVHSYVLMPDHAHLIICIAPGSKTTLGAWVKAFKALVARHEFKWQTGYFDHVLRSDQSRTEK